MISDQSLQSARELLRATETQLRTIEKLGGIIDEKVRTAIREVVVNEIDAVVKKLRETHPNVDLDRPVHNTRALYPTELWIEGEDNRAPFPTYHFRIHETGAEFLKKLAVEGGIGSSIFVNLPAEDFMKMISELKTTITKGEMDQQIHSHADFLIYISMRQVEERLIPVWRRQLEPEYKQQQKREMIKKNLSNALSRYFASSAARAR